MCALCTLDLLCATLGHLSLFMLCPANAIIANSRFSVDFVTMLFSGSAEFVDRLLQLAAFVVTHPHSTGSASSRTLFAAILS